MSSEKLKKKLHNALKLSGFNIRREFCNLIVDRFLSENFELSDNNVFDNVIKNICESLERQNLSTDYSIEKEHIERAFEACLNSGYDSHETVFSVINAFDYPKLIFDPDRKNYSIDSVNKPKLLSDANSRTNLYRERYNTILQQIKRNSKLQKSITLQTVDYLLTLSSVSMKKILILGSLLQVSERKFYLEDPTGIVELDFTHAKFQDGFFMENSFVLVNGVYDDKVLQVSSVVLPPGEEYRNSRPLFGNINYFGGLSNTPLKDSHRLQEHLIKNASDMILLFSDVWLDHSMIFEKLDCLFNGIQSCPPIAFVFMGNFLSQSHGSEGISKLKKLFKQLADLILKYPSLVQNSHFVFVPGPNDPCTPYIVPRLALPKFITEDMSKIIPKSTFATNPCRLQYCTKEIVVYRMDVVTKFMQATIHKPPKEKIIDCIGNIFVSQAHLSPMSLNAQPVHWDFDHCLKLYPLPDLIVIGDKHKNYTSEAMGCTITNPGSFCDHAFTFSSYTPAENKIDECSI